MSQPRKFSIRNDDGDILALSEHRTTGIASINPKGLGVGFENTVENFSTAQIVKARRAKLPDFEIDIVLGMNWSNATPRKLYMQIIEFFNKPPYTLIYNNDNGEFYKEVELLDMPMTDIKESQTIQETLKFTQTGLWYQEQVFVGSDPVLPRTDAEGYVYRADDKLTAADPDKLGRAYNVKGKRLDTWSTHDNLHEDFEEGVVFSSNMTSASSAGVFDLHNDSIYFGLQDSSPLEIVIKGAGSQDVQPSVMQNPWWEVVDADGKVIATDMYLTPLYHFEQLVVRSGYGRNAAYIVNTDTGARRDAYQLQDHTKTNFIQVPLGNSQLRFHTTNNTEIGAGDVRITMRKEYIMVA